jgi:hypothetical protein
MSPDVDDERHNSATMVSENKSFLLAILFDGLLGSPDLLVCVLSSKRTRDDEE